MSVTTELPDEDERHSPITATAAAAADLLAIADHLLLVQPCLVSVHDSAYISLQLPPESGSIDAIRVWASTFCAAMRSDTHEGKNGPEIWINTDFDLNGVAVHVYAHIPVPETEPITRTEQDSEPAF